MNRIERVGSELLEMSVEERLQVCRWLERRGMPQELVFFSGGPEDAYDSARRGGGSSFLRGMASKDAYYAYQYACEVDEGPHGVTRAGACQTPLRALHYAEGVDGGYHEDTWAAVKGTGYEGEYRTRVGVPEGV